MAENSSQTTWQLISVAAAGLATWLTTQGWAWYKDWRKQRREEQKERVPFSQERIFEDRNLQMGYKALMLVQDERIRELETGNKSRDDRISQLETEHRKCLQDHAAVNAHAQALEKELVTVKERHAFLERRLTRVMRKVQIDDDQEDQHEQS